MSAWNFNDDVRQSRLTGWRAPPGHVRSRCRSAWIGLGGCREGKAATLKVLLNQEQLRDGVAQLAEKIAAHYGDRPLTIVAIMTGSLIFLADLSRLLKMPVRISLIQASSYRGGTEPGQLWIRDDMMLDVRGRDVLVLDDIFDTGKTLHEVMGCVSQMGPGSVASAVLLHKVGRQQVSSLPDFVAFQIPDQFVVGYGLDYRDLYRNLPFVAILESQDLEA